MSDNITPKFVPAEELVEKLLDTDKEKVLPKVLDVREVEQFEGGHIKGASNFPSELWDNVEYVDGVIEKNKDEKVVVMHCMHSQKRGPNCAKILMKRLQERIDLTNLPEV